jgi:hypothetical protein
MVSGILSEDFKNTLYSNVIEKTFPNLITEHKNILHKYLIATTQTIIICYEFYTDIDNYIKKLTQNNYKDLKWLLMCLIPYIKQNIKPLSELIDLNELYILRYDKPSSKVNEDVLMTHIEDINFTEPKYVFSNLQYGRVNRSNDHYTSIKFDEHHIRDNYYLLLNTIKKTRYKMYINWIDIVPYRLDNYNNSILFENTFNKINNNNYSDWDPVDIYPIESINDNSVIENFLQKVKGLEISDIYNTISMDLYTDIVKYKWLIFDVSLYVENKKRIVTLVQCLQNIMYLPDCIAGYNWIDNKFKDRFIETWELLVSRYIKNGDLNAGSIIIPAKTIDVVIHAIVVFFDRVYSNIKHAEKDTDIQYIPLNYEKNRNNLDDYKERMPGLERKIVIPTLKSINHVHLYQFLRETFEGFKTTWYAHHLMSKNKLSIVSLNHRGYKIMSDGESYISYKNIYNL